MVTCANEVKEVRGIPFSLTLAQLIDSAFPTGAFAHSFGLEAAVQEGRIVSPGDLVRWLSDCLRGNLAPMEGRAVRIAYRYCETLRSSARSDWREPLCELDCRITLAKLAEESRVGAMKVGKQYLRMATQLYPDSQLAHYSQWIAQGLCYGSSAIVHAWLCEYLQQDMMTAVQSYLYSSVNVLIQNVQRTAVIGQTAAQQALQAILPVIAEESAAIVGLPDSRCRLSARAVFQEITAMHHETLYSRLFMS